MISKFDAPLYVTKSALPSIEEYTELINNVWGTNILTNNGPLHSKLEVELKSKLCVVCRVERNSNLVQENVRTPSASTFVEIKFSYYDFLHNATIYIVPYMVVETNQIMI